MAKDVRTTLYINEELSKRFRDACNKKFGDRQGKIKQGYVLAITNFCDVVELDQVDDVLAKKLIEDSIKKEAQASVNLDHGELQTHVEETKRQKADDIEAKAKKLAEERKQDSTEHQVLT